MKTLLIILLTLFGAHQALATTLSDLAPHEATGSPWSEQWFYYLNDPAIGYFKISLQTYIKPDAADQTEKGYVQFVLAPVDGELTIYDYFFDEVEVAKTDNGEEYSFTYRIPGAVEADENGVQLTTPDFNFSMRWTGEHRHYWNNDNPGRSPYGVLAELPGFGADWFIFSMRTPARYEFSRDGGYHSGYGTVHSDKGWYSSQSAYDATYMYLMAVTDRHQLMFDGASKEILPIELWAGKYLSQDLDLDLIFYPTATGLGAKRTIDSCAGELSLEMWQLETKIVIDAKADIDSFYTSEMPSLIVFGSTNPIMKSMHADMDVKIYKWGQLVEEVTLPQGLLEFGGEVYCNQ